MPPAAFRRTVVITGPTGSGKSALALALAERAGGEIVAMDSMTLYRGLDVGTAKPTAEERERVPHHLIDVLDPSESANVSWWLARTAECVADIEGRGKTAFLVGGTPLYLKAILYGLFDGPPGDLTVRQQYESQPPAELHARLAEVDPPSARRLHPNDVRRVARALEVWTVTGRPLSDWQREWSDAAPPAPPRIWCVERPRSELYSRIDARVLAMIDAGWLAEVRRLRDRPKPPSREASAALGYPELNSVLDGLSDMPTAVRLIQQRTRNFARRQLTWFRSLPAVEFVPGELTEVFWQTRMNLLDFGPRVG